MQDTVPTPQQAPQQAPQTPANLAAASLAALEAALKKAASVVLVTPEENDKAVKAAAKEAKKLLKQLRGDTGVEALIAAKTPPAANTLHGRESGKELVLPIAKNANITPDEQRQIDLATEQFKQSVVRVDNQILNLYVQAVQNGNYAEAEAILANATELQQVNTLMFALLTISVILLPLYARQRLNKLLVQFGLHTVFAHTDEGQKAIREQAQKGAESHVNTIAKDVKKSLDQAIDSELPTVRDSMEERFPNLKGVDQKDYLNDVRENKDMYQYARELILTGVSRDTVIKKLQENFSEVGKKRANVIAGNESNRVFTLSQYEADEQFLAQNKLGSKAYKRLISNTGTPESLCKAIIEATHLKPIPFHTDFLKFGQAYSYTSEDGKKHSFTPNYERLRGGTIHVNCHCRYELLIKQDDGTFFNTYDGKVLNNVVFEAEDLAPEYCRCCEGSGEHDTGKECYGCDGSGLDKDYTGENPCDGTKVEDNSFSEGDHPRWPKGTPKGGKFMKMGDINVDKHVDMGVEIMNALQKAHDDHDWALSGFGDPEVTRKEVQDIESIMYKHYGKALADNGFTEEDHKKLRQAQIDYSRGAGMRDAKGSYLQEPELAKQTGASMVHTALTQAILSKSNTKFKLFRGEKEENTVDPKGIVSYTDSRAVSISFGSVTKTKEVDVTGIQYHYLLDFTTVHPSEQEVIVKQ